MKIGIACDDWRFFKNKCEALKNHYEVRTLSPSNTKISLGRYQSLLYKRNLHRLMRWSDVIFFEFANKPLAIASQMKKVSKIVVRLHRYELFSWADKIDWKKIDKVILVSTAMQKRLVNQYPFMENRTAVIYNDIDTDKFIPINTKLKKSIGIAGEITPRKRVYELILAFDELQRNVPDIKLRICGPTIYDETYNTITRELVAKLNLEDKVFFDGHFETVDKLVNWYNKVDILICNSSHESFHLTSHEAMACGCYALSHFWDGSDEFYDCDQIYKTDGELIRKIQAFYSIDEKSRQELSKKMRQEIIDRYDSKKQFDELVTLIDKCYSNEKI